MLKIYCSFVQTHNTCILLQKRGKKKEANGKEINLCCDDDVGYSISELTDFQEFKTLSQYALGF